MSGALVAKKPSFVQNLLTFSFSTRRDGVWSVLKVVVLFLIVKLARYLKWRRSINRRIPGPPDNLMMGASMELYRAGLNDFWGFNPKLFKSLFSRYGKVARFWLPGTGLFVCFSDPADIAEMNNKARARPALTETLLPFLGKENLLFQKGDMIKKLRLRYGKMVNGRDTLESVHTTSIEMLSKRTRHWAEGKPVDLHGELGPLIYDIMGKVLFGGSWSQHESGQTIRKLHVYLIEWSSRYGMKVLKTPSWRNFCRSFSDMSGYFKAIKDLRKVCGDMIDRRREDIRKNPKAYANDKTALTMLVTDPVSEADKKPFFSKNLAISTMLGFLNGAYDTTHSTVFWVMYHLARHQETQEKLIKELDGQFRGKQPDVDECRRFKFLDAVIKESMRIRPTVPIGMRVPEEDVTIGGHEIPKGSTLLPFLDLKEGTEKYFGKDTENFRPERFLGESSEATTARNTIDRFGGGVRMCVGMTFALAELNAIVTSVLQHYTIHLADPGMPEPEIIYEAGVYQPKEHFGFVFKKR